MPKNSIIFGTIIISVSVAFYIGTYRASMTALIPGVSPAGVSWIGHASGLLGGVITAFTVSTRHS